MVTLRLGAGGLERDSFLKLEFDELGVHQDRDVSEHIELRERSTLGTTPREKAERKTLK